MNLNLKNKTLLITGGTGGFGKVIIKKFISQNCKVIATTTKKGNQKNSKRLKIIQLDLNDKNSIIKFENEIKKINKIDFLINNAGINVLNKFII